MSPFSELNMTTVGSSRSTGVTPLPHYYGPLRLPIRQLTGLWIPLLPPGYKPQPIGSPRFLDLSFVARRPLPPRWAVPLRLLVASRNVLASSSLADWPPTTSVSRPCLRFNLSAYGSRLRRPAVSRLRQASCPDRPRSPCLVTSARQAAATCTTSNLHGNLLSGCWKGQV